MESGMGSSSTSDQEQSPKRSSILLSLERNQKGKLVTSAELRQILSEETAKVETLAERKNDLQTAVKTEILDRASDKYEKIRYLGTRCTTLKGHMNKISKEKLPSRLERPDIYICVDNMTQLEKALAYLRAVKFVKEYSEKIEANLESGLPSEAIDIFQFLLRLKQSYVVNTDCTNFKNYFNQTVSYWEKCLLERFVKEMQKLLDAFGWPSATVTSTPTLETRDKFHRTITCMIRLSLSLNSGSNSAVTSSEDKPALVKDFKEPLLLPIQVMAEPLRKRFKYHFFINKITSDPTRPEWYFTQIKSWARELIPFIRTHLEPLVSEANHLSAVADFVSALSEMLILKADSQLSNGSDQVDDVIFARILEESIIFENEMGNFLGEDLVDKKIYIPPFVSTLFSQPHVLQRWLAIERKACLEKLDEIFSSPTAWDRAVVPGTTEVEDLFMAVLRFVIDRFAHLQQQSQKVLFLKLLVDMIDDFRVRCLQTWKSRREIEADYKDGVLIDYIIADTLRSVQTTIESWEDLPFFASISFFLGNSASGEECDDKGDDEAAYEDANSSLVRDDPSIFTFDGDIFRQGLKEEDQGAQIGSPYRGLFSNVLKLYECLGEDILRKWCRTAVEKLRADIMPKYAKRKWHTFPPDGFEENGATVSEGLLDAVQRLKALSKGVATGMNPDVAQLWLKRLAIQFDEMLMDTLVYPNRFTPGAVVQLRYDMNFGIFPIFADSNIPTGMFLVGMTSTLKIWEMPIGKALLLCDALTDPSASFESQEEVLAELELSLRPSDVIKLLKTRTDINI